MEENDEGKAEKFFKEFGKKLDSFMVRSKRCWNPCRGGHEGEYEELKVAAEKFKKKLKQRSLERSGSESLKKAGEELNNALRRPLRNLNSSFVDSL
jgi:hypothetical protein